MAGRTAIPQDVYEAAEVDGAIGVKRFVHVTFPLLANLYLVCTLLSTIWTLGDFNTVYFISGGGPALSTQRAGHAGHPQRVPGRQSVSGHGDGDVGAAAADPAGDHADAQARDAPRCSYERRGRVGGPDAAARLHTAGQVLIGLVILIWTVLPLYNMVEVALRPKDAVFSGDLFPANPTLMGFWDVLTQNYWYRCAFLARDGEQPVSRRGDRIADAGDRHADQFRDRADAHSRRVGHQQRRAADLRDPDVVPGDPVLPGDAELRPGRQSVGGDPGRGHLRHAVRDLHFHGVQREHSESRWTKRRGSTAPRPGESTGGSICR